MTWLLIVGHVSDSDPIFILNVRIFFPNGLSRNTSTYSRVIDACIISLTVILPTSSFLTLRCEVVGGHSYVLIAWPSDKNHFLFSTNFCFILVISKFLIKSILKFTPWILILSVLNYIFLALKLIPADSTFCHTNFCKHRLSKTLEMLRPHLTLTKHRVFFVLVPVWLESRGRDSF